MSNPPHRLTFRMSDCGLKNSCGLQLPADHAATGRPPAHQSLLYVWIAERPSRCELRHTAAWRRVLIVYTAGQLRSPRSTAIYHHV